MSDNTKETSWGEAIAGLVFLFLILLKESSKEKELKIWDKFENEIAHNNRFFPEAKCICEALDFYSKRAVYTLRKGEKTIFRARLIKSMEKLPLPTQVVAYFASNEWSDFLQNTDEQTNDTKLSNELESCTEFWGFDSEGSDAPPTDKASAGRINPAGISYLYATEDPHTAVVEARPALGQIVSIAEIETKKDLKLFDFCIHLVDGDNIEEHKGMFEEIARRLSMPNHVGNVGYYATQYVSQYIKKLKDSFDGIRFQSSLHKGGVNIVLFDTTKDEETKEPRNYVIKNSSIHYVDNITISERKILPR